MMTLQEQVNRLWELKKKCELDVYYQIDTSTFGIPVLVNRVNKHSILNGKNSWTKFTTVVTVNNDDPELFDVRLLYKNDASRSLMCKKKVPMNRCHFWMKQFYSSVQLMLRSWDPTPTTHDDIVNSDEFFEQCERLEKMARVEAS